MIRLITLLATLGALLSVSAAHADEFDTYVELLRSDIMAEKIAVIRDVMEFTDEEGARFWPVYREYQRQLSMIWDERIALIKQFVEFYGSFDDKQSKKIAEKAFRLETRRTNLKRKFFPRFEKAVGAKRAAQFFQLERQLNLLIELQVSAELPLLD